MLSCSQVLLRTSNPAKREITFRLDNTQLCGARCHDGRSAQVGCSHPAVKVGFIGLGMMGAGMAGRLLAAGHEVSVYNRTASKAHALVASGARLARSSGGRLS